MSQLFWALENDCISYQLQVVWICNSLIVDHGSLTMLKFMLSPGCLNDMVVQARLSIQLRSNGGCDTGVRKPLVTYKP